MTSALLTPAMQNALKGPRRTLCWLFWLEGATADLYAWTGAQPIAWDGHTYVGLGALLSMTTQKKPDALQHVEHSFTLSGLEPDLISGLDTSVRGRTGKVWLGALDARNRIVADPLLLTEIVQDTLKLDRGTDDTVSMTLTGYEALPFLGRVRGDKYSHDRWLSERGDSGFFYTSPIAASGRAVDWRP